MGEDEWVMVFYKDFKNPLPITIDNSMPNQENVFTPVDILNITKEHLKTVVSSVVLEGEHI